MPRYFNYRPLALGDIDAIGLQHLCILYLWSVNYSSLLVSKVTNPAKPSLSRHVV